MTTIEAGFTLALMTTGGLLLVGIGLALTVHLVSGGK